MDGVQTRTQLELLPIQLTRVSDLSNIVASQWKTSSSLKIWLSYVCCFSKFLVSQKICNGKLKTKQVWNLKRYLIFHGKYLTLNVCSNNIGIEFKEDVRLGLRAESPLLIPHLLKGAHYQKRLLPQFLHNPLLSFMAVFDTIYLICNGCFVL